MNNLSIYSLNYVKLSRDFYEIYIFFTFFPVSSTLAPSKNSKSGKKSLRNSQFLDEINLF